jgi:hypothetical protein
MQRFNSIKVLFTRAAVYNIFQPLTSCTNSMDLPSIP